ncbi:hypothetical protein [Bdellovibrio sp. HCB337]|uniref:hypothetical protein n=1 Tax=Bdellovibrio sp. HCB337 TaxID=3394358 RepID=UPI0039A5BD89
MKNKIKLNFFFLILFTANQTFAAKFYFKVEGHNSGYSLLTGDLNFSYSVTKIDSSSQEAIEMGLTRITIHRNAKDSTMWVEQRTKNGFLYLTYQNAGNDWEQKQVSFRKYQTHFKDDDDTCEVPPLVKNQDDMGSVANSLLPQNFSSVVFEKNCAEKLTKEELETFSNSMYILLAGDRDVLATLKEPPSLRCLDKQAQSSSPLFHPFEKLRGEVDLLTKSAESTDDVKKNVSTPFPISCDFDGSKHKKCGRTQEGQKAKISVDVECLKKDPKMFRVNVHKMFIHEFTHNVRSPKAISEAQAQQIDKGICSLDKTQALFGNAKEINLSKDNVIKKLNSEQTGAKTIAGDVANPYASFAETESLAPTQPSNTTTASNDLPSRNEGIRNTGLGSTNSAQRSIASIDTFNSPSNSKSSSKTSTPTIEQQAKYENTKSYVKNSVDAIAKKIAPYARYVETPAFAATLPAQGTPDTNSLLPTAPDTNQPPARPAPATQGTSSEIGSSSSSGSRSSSAPRAATSAGIPSSGVNRAPAAAKSADRKTASDENLENAYALKIRKRLVSDRAFAEDLRSRGVHIEFADGYKFENSRPQVIYTEKNGVLKGDK